MKRIILIFTILILFAVPAHALLEDNLDGTITQTRNDGSMLMWLQDANLSATENFGVSGISTTGKITWYKATEWTVNWIAGMNDANYLGYNDWRLPDTLPVNGSTYNYGWNNIGSVDRGYNITSPNSELAYMFYTELGNKGYYDTASNPEPTGWGLTNTGLFDNLQPDLYWSGTEYALHPVNAWIFHFNDGYQNGNDKSGQYGHVWAVRDCPSCTTVVPEPISSLLFLSGGTLLAGRRWLRRWK